VEQHFFGPAGFHFQAVLGGAGNGISTGVTYFTLNDGDGNPITVQAGQRIVLNGYVVNSDNTQGNSYDVILFIDTDGGGHSSTSVDLHRGGVPAQGGQPFGVNPCRIVGPKLTPANAAGTNASKAGRLAISLTAIGGAGSPTDFSVTVYGQIVGEPLSFNNATK
jgi:hypothetical protein